MEAQRRDRRSLSAHVMEGRSLSAQVMEGRSLSAQVMQGRSLSAQVMQGRSLSAHVMQGRSLSAQVMQGRSLSAQVMQGTMGLTSFARIRRRISRRPLFGANKRELMRPAAVNRRATEGGGGGIGQNVTVLCGVCQCDVCATAAGVRCDSRSARSVEP
jgi:hypothetical protein